jgi:nitrogen fixation/metabolism regulation signal transduction histidine kinase
LTGWWDEVSKRYAEDHIHFEARLGADPLIPAEMFDSVVENLLENARIKRQSEPGIETCLRAMSDAQAARVSICDNGSPIPENIAHDLLQAPVSSRTGLGIGLYQAARQAERAGYALRLTQNCAGAVEFTLAKDARTQEPCNESDQRLAANTRQSPRSAQTKPGGG